MVTRPLRDYQNHETMLKRYYRMSDGGMYTTIAKETDDPELTARLILEIQDDDEIEPRPRCELCVFRETCWQYEARRVSGRVCEAFSFWD